jgi:hypothetical protein
MEYPDGRPVEFQAVLICGACKTRFISIDTTTGLTIPGETRPTYVVEVVQDVELEGNQRAFKIETPRVELGLNAVIYGLERKCEIVGMLESEPGYLNVVVQPLEPR